MCGTGELSTHKESFEHHTGYSVTVLTPDSRGRSLSVGGLPRYDHTSLF